MRPVFLFRQTILSVLKVPAGTVTVSSASTVTVSTRSSVWRAVGRSSTKIWSHVFEPAQVEAVKRHLPVALKPLLTFGAITGWRLREVLRLTGEQADFHASAVGVEPRNPKNRLGGRFPLTQQHRELPAPPRANTETTGLQSERVTQSG